MNGAAVRSIWIDFPFIVSYVPTIGLIGVLACRAAQHEGLLSPTDAANLATALLVIAVAAGLSDVFEDFGLLLELSGKLNRAVVLLTSSFSTVKWALLLTALACPPVVLALSALHSLVA
jgi:hypothetical protein